MYKIILNIIVVTLLIFCNSYGVSIANYPEKVLFIKMPQKESFKWKEVSRYINKNLGIVIYLHEFKDHIESIVIDYRDLGLSKLPVSSENRNRLEVIYVYSISNQNYFVRAIIRNKTNFSILCRLGQGELNIEELTKWKNWLSGIQIASVE